MVKVITTVGLILVLTLCSVAADGTMVLYAGGTIPGMSVNSSGRLDFSSPSALLFDSTAGRLEIPYSSISSFNYEREVTHHLGVLPAIAVGLLASRRHRHFFRIAYREAAHEPSGSAQVVIFEVPKQSVRVIQATLQARVRPADYRVPCMDQTYRCWGSRKMTAPPHNDSSLPPSQAPPSPPAASDK